jgi:pantoate kinase
MRSMAFCPGHLTGFFQVREHLDIDSTGSRGAGICLTMGATTKVTATRGRGRIEVLVNGIRDQAPVTRQAMAMLMDSPEHDIKVETRLDLPMRQGFGMSAAGALSTALAITDIMGLDFDDALRAAHHAEVLHRAGLGDVMAMSRGGITFRRREGLPPHGVVERLGKDIPLVIAIVGPEILTSSVLEDREMAERVDVVGGQCISSLESSPSLANFFRLCEEFARRTGLMTLEVENALESIVGLGPGSMVMLGNSIFASGEVEEEYQVLSHRYDAHRVGIDWQGPRVVDSDR